ncbi:SepM family pheromone-processing serine protease [Paludifilum halophilum]|uniref:endopeptidase La n=1 Tax=Paludifilum halophilum TaxID=1642702 RepID=A0A235B2A2_9BACL|nr:SepM family pheromone-processing serine protease [Paludifilum halophilum]OYD06440.1 hypothetical protein CHM34_16225 [Paludifilum halophilum]
MRILYNRYRPWVIVTLVALMVFAVLFFVPVPYYIVQPGSALEVRPMIQVDQAKSGEKGAFMMTTVSMREGNVLGYLASQMSPSFERIPKGEVLGRGEDPEEYQHRQVEIMDQSQQNAVIAAFREMGRPVQEKFLGVQVLRLLKNMPAQNVLQEGDLIWRVDGERVRTTEDLITYLSHKKPGDTVEMRVKRKDHLLNEEVTLASLDPSGGGERAGVGIEPITLRKVKTDPEVRIDAKKIGGPSAGLMFTLEIMNQLEEGDLTQGLRVAGTGTITPAGEVGQIGGVHHKVRAAEAEGADIFFVPADVDPQDTNEKRALATAEKIGTDMKVVPVRTLSEAIDYLEGRAVKKRAS